MLYHLGMDAEPFISSFDASTAYKAKVNTDPDILTFDQAMQDPQHRDAWRESALAEIRQLESKGTWKEVPLSDATSRVLPGTWVFHIRSVVQMARSRSLRAITVVMVTLKKANSICMLRLLHSLPYVCSSSQP